jgi:hypothetical protein
MGAGELESVDHRRAAPTSELITKEGHGPERSGVNMPCLCGKRKDSATNDHTSKTAGLKTGRYRKTKSEEPGSPE